jgi:hypothetical protein
MPSLPLLLHFFAFVLAIALPHQQAQAPRGARRARAKCHSAWLWWMSPHDNRWAAAGVLLQLQQQQQSVRLGALMAAGVCSCQLQQCWMLAAHLHQHELSICILKPLESCSALMERPPCDKCASQLSRCTPSKQCQSTSPHSNAQELAATHTQRQLSANGSSTALRPCSRAWMRWRMTTLMMHPTPLGWVLAMMTTNS